ncbi:amino acid ABC transporter substrate-binding protein, PAAT family [Desulfocicer vacuolatum DSM 3385]|uniref:Amino acid ABC transporter substrate-binding protein, PAAT family n=1 Tax=Desulfocicer vacuolatum DSM 3385 TaxID=1121400 RepID=A0A1W2A1C7_9BACT|nr:transporter substrate-binding domain-containing protein [Desulfocicer vacuolatum]SMC54423.1 amino acid ABC transporter substrate-binding protein, PAAT family [Desulfocicer vacuolatum DSM 3385]
MNFTKKLTTTFFFMGVMLMTTVSTGHTETLRLGMTPEPYMPFTQINSAGVWEGLEAELTNVLCEKMGTQCKISQMAWEGLIPSLTENKVDFIVGAFSITDKRREIVDFSLPYYNETSVLVGMKADKATFSNKTDAHGAEVVDAKGLSGKIIGVQNASVQGAYAKTFLSKVETKSYPAADNVVADLTAGRIDYALLTAEFIQPFLESKDGADYEIKHKIPGNVILGEGIAYAVRKGDKATLEKINAVLTELDHNGSLEAMVQKWFFGKK